MEGGHSSSNGVKIAAETSQPIRQGCPFQTCLLFCLLEMQVEAGQVFFFEGAGCGGGLADNFRSVSNAVPLPKITYGKFCFNLLGIDKYATVALPDSMTMMTLLG